jgi:hypothetical protein
MGIFTSIPKLEQTPFLYGLVFETIPVWKQVPVSIWWSPYRNREPCHQAPHMEMGLAYFHIGICLSPFPYGDHHMETGTCFIVLPIWKQGYPYGNGDLQGMCQFPFPYGNRRMETGSYFIRFPIWKQGSPYGNGYPRFHMVIPGHSKVLEYCTIFEERCCRR